MKRVSRATWDSLLVPRRCICGNPIALGDLLPSAFSSSVPPSTSTIRALTPPSQKSKNTRLFHTSTPLSVIPKAQPTQSAKLAALHGRLELPNKYPLTTLGRALIDPTAEPQHHLNNDSLSTVGNVLLGYYASEYLMVTYPRLPYAILKSAMEGYVGDKALAAVGTEWGVEAAFAPGTTVDPGLLQFNRLAPGMPWLPQTRMGGLGLNPPMRRRKMMPTFEHNPSLEKQLASEPEAMKRARAAAARGPGSMQDAVPLEAAMANFVRATVGGVYLHAGGLLATKGFVSAHILSRKLDVDKLFQFEQPTRELSRLCVREGFHQPIARLEKETGRYSRHPVFIVGVYSGEEKLGEGQGGSLPEAKIKAAISALKGWYLYSPVTGVDLPSKTDGEPEAPFSPSFIDVGDVVS
ncbi:54S ribosomal protein L3 [Drechslerella dactyloides]|uniref:Large ribosomal subunit protein mL44 n=1 Tax=Drechslerella dactyloides TaxID=74499 RepID=A0AAD6IS35_DREDA|nr:54S ribosomal protein L3 [Drechslerella dactyloides]